MNPLNPDRYYEVVELHDRDAYDQSMIGTIIQPTSMRDDGHVVGWRCGRCRVIQRRGILATFDHSATFVAVRLRPLTIKEQEKIDESRHHAA